MARHRKRSSKRKARARSSYFDIPYRQLRNPWPAYEIVGQDEIEAIHNASMQILENTGVRFLDDEALDLWTHAGAKVDRAEKQVWLDRGLIMELLAQAPSGFTFRARNPDRSRYIGGNAINFFPNAGMVFANDLEQGRRPGQKEDYINLAKLIQMTNVLHFAPVQAINQHATEEAGRHQPEASHSRRRTYPEGGVGHGQGQPPVDRKEKHEANVVGGNV